MKTSKDWAPFSDHEKMVVELSGKLMAAWHQDHENEHTEDEAIMFAVKVALKVVGRVLEVTRDK